MEDVGWNGRHFQCAESAGVCLAQTQSWSAELFEGTMGLHQVVSGTFTLLEFILRTMELTTTDVYPVLWRALNAYLSGYLLSLFLNQHILDHYGEGIAADELQVNCPIFPRLKLY